MRGRKRGQKHGMMKSKLQWDAFFPSVLSRKPILRMNILYLTHTHEIGNAAWAQGKLDGQIAEMTRKGYIPAHIRKELRLTTPTEVFYAICRPILTALIPKLNFDVDEIPMTCHHEKSCGTVGTVERGPYNFVP